MSFTLTGNSAALEGAWTVAKDRARKSYVQNKKFWAATTTIFLAIVRKDPSLVAEYRRVHGHLPKGMKEEPKAPPKPVKGSHVNYRMKLIKSQLKSLKGESLCLRP